MKKTKVYSNTGLFDGYFFYKEGIEIPVRASSITPDSMKVAHDAGIKERYYNSYPLYFKLDFIFSPL